MTIPSFALSILLAAQVVQAQPMLVKDINPGPNGSYPQWLSPTSNGLFFAASDDIRGREPWITDGTETGTALIDDLSSGTSWSFFYGAAAQLGTTQVWKVRSSPGTGLSRLWRTDGTAAGSQFISPTNADFGYSFDVELNSERILTGYTPTSGTELWRTDGTIPGTELLAELTPGSQSTYFGDAVRLGALVLFVAETPATGRELWRTDGTAAGTSLVVDLAPGNSHGVVSSPILIGGNGFAYFIGTSDGVAQGLWRTDGTAVGTVEIESPGTFGGRDYARFSAAGGKLFIAMYEVGSQTQNSLWVSSGSPGSATMVADGFVGNGEINPVQFGREAGGNMFFTSDPNFITSQLWVSDGTTAGTTMLRQFVQSDIQFSASIGPTVVFAADDGDSGMELWASDGTAMSTRLLADISPGTASSYPSGLTTVGSTVYFAAADAIVGNELWRIELGMSCRADWNGDVAVNVPDIFAFLSAWFAGDADIDGNGGTAVPDIFAFLSLWFEGC